MPQKSNSLERFWKELKRRKVTHVITGYAATAFVILQLVDIVAQPLHLPAWTLTSLIIILCVGFIVVLILSWNYDFTASGVKKTKSDVDIEPKEQLTTKTISGWQVATYISLLIIVALIAFNYVTKRRLSNEIMTSEKSIAVLPFKLLSAEPDKQYLADGMMDAILLHLSYIRALHVISRTSVEQYRETNKTIPVIGQELDAEYILEGSFQKSGENVKLIVQLIKTKKENHLWANEYSRNWNDIFLVQSEVAQKIASELNAVITPGEKQLIEKLPTDSLEAYNDYLQGVFYWRKFTSPDQEVALHYFEQAIEKDPKYALAYAALSSVWVRRGVIGAISSVEATSKSMAALTKALELDSTRAEIYRSLAMFHMSQTWDWKSAESSFKKAIALNPNYADAHILYGHLLIIVGRLKEALQQDELALKLDPLNISFKAHHGFVLLFSRRYYDAITIYQEVLKTDPADMYVLSNLPEAFHMVGKYKEEFEAWKAYFTTSFKDFVHVFDQVNVKADYASILNLEADTLAAQSKTKLILPTEIALVYACSGNKERAMDMLDRAYEIHDPNLTCLLHPGYDSLRNEPRFQALCKKMNLPYK